MLFVGRPRIYSVGPPQLQIESPQLIQQGTYSRICALLRYRRFPLGQEEAAMGGLLNLSFKHNIFRYFRNENTLFQGNNPPFATLFQGNEVCRWGYKALAIGGERMKKKRTARNGGRWRSLRSRPWARRGTQWEC